MRVDRTPEYIGGVDPVVENVALSPILTLKSLGSVGRKILEKTGLRNPVTHYTTGSGAAEILKSGTIRGVEGGFPGKPFYRDSRKYLNRQLNRDKTGWLSETDIKFQEQFPKSPSVSVTRDPMFLSRPHGHVGSDIGLIMDRDNMIKKGLKIQPFVEKRYEKMRQEYPPFGSPRPNPIFEFEERVRGYVPTENVRLIDLARLSPEQSNIDLGRFQSVFELARSKKPIVKSFEAKEELQKTLNMLKNISNLRLPKGKPFTQYLQEQGIDIPDYMQATKDLLNTPTYRFNPFLKKA